MHCSLLPNHTTLFAACNQPVTSMRTDDCCVQVCCITFHTKTKHRNHINCSHKYQAVSSTLQCMLCLVLSRESGIHSEHAPRITVTPPKFSVRVMAESSALKDLKVWACFMSCPVCYGNLTFISTTLALAVRYLPRLCQEPCQWARWVDGLADQTCMYCCGGA